MLKNPELASCVRSFVMDRTRGCDSYCAGNWEFKIIDEIVQGVIFRSSLSRIQQKWWAGLLKKGDEDAYVALLLSSLPIVKILDLRVPGDGLKILDRRAIKGGNSLPDPTSLSFAESGGH